MAHYLKNLKPYRVVICVICGGQSGNDNRYSSPITGPRCPEGSRKLGFPDYVTMAQDGGRLSALRICRFTPRKYSWYSFLLEAVSTPEP